MASFKIDRIKKERRQSESERTEGLFQSIDWIIDKYPTIPIQPKTRVDDYSMIMQFPPKSLVTDEMYSYIQSALMINGWNISDWNENEVTVLDFFTMIDDGVPLPNNGGTPRYDEIGKSARPSKRSFNDMVKAQRVPTLEEDRELREFAKNLAWAVMGELITLRERIDRFSPPTHPARYMRMKEAFDKFEEEYIKCVDYYDSMVMYHP